MAAVLSNLFVKIRSVRSAEKLNEQINKEVTERICAVINGSEDEWFIKLDERDKECVKKCVKECVVAPTE